MNSKGTHIFLDLTGFISTDNLETKAHFIYNLMIESIETLTKMKIVHKHLEILREPETANGFTSVLLLDESHISSHCYSDLGILAIDVFTCGKTDTKIVADFLINSIQKKYNIIITNYVINKRFKI